MNTKRIVAIIGAVVAALSCSVVASSAVARAEEGCPNLYVVAIPGTWETSDDAEQELSHGMLSFVTDGLSESIHAEFVAYPATAFPWEGEVYGRSKAEAVDSAREMITEMARRCAATRIALLGYSQGADAAGDLAAEIGTGAGAVPPDRIVAVGLISDPRRSPADILVGPSVDGAGAGGARVGGFGLLGQRTRSICAVGDLYCSTSHDDFVTRFAGFVAQVSDPSLANLWQYQLEAETLLGDLMAGGGITLLQDQFSDAANRQRIERLDQFYRSHVHTNYAEYDVGFGKTATSWMHDWLGSLG
ncbi:cutinase family protein [Nocardia terpenica]|uniref:Cutinase n=1 Tax=Nocardia terpenica TaxID=455432 RepID=A0A291RPB7_9NOCA|nr:cutinase family protein [Nocardia terpenica]ATL69177.1 cutinase [Nocardia terpenica]